MTVLRRLVPSRFASARWLASLAAGTLAGSSCLAILVSLWLACGGGREVDLAMLIAVTIGCSLSRFEPLRRLRTRWSLLGMPACAWVTPLVIALWRPLVGLISVEQLQSNVVATCVALIPSALVLVPFVSCVCGWASLSENRNKLERSGLLLGGASALWMLPLAVPAMGGLLPLTITMSLLAAILVIVSGWIPQPEIFTDDADDRALRHADDHLTGVLERMALGALVGAGAAFVQFELGQLIPRTMMTDLWLLASVLSGVVIAVSFWPRRLRSNATAATVCAAWIGLAGAGYPLWGGLCLRMNAWVSHLGLLMTCRAALVALLSAPAGWLLFHVIVNRDGTTHRVRGDLFVPISVPVGFLLAVLMPWQPIWLAIAIVGAACLVVLNAWRTELSEGMSRRRRTLRVSGLTCLALVAGGIPWLMTPLKTDKLLFSSTALQQFRNGNSAAEINWLDDGRLQAEFATVNGRCSVWSYRGDQLVARSNGLVEEMQSISPTICPRGVSDILPALLPMTLHPDAEHVLVLGFHSPSLQVCHAWPLRTVTTTIENQSSRAMLDWLLSDPDYELNQPAAAESEYLDVDPVLAMRGVHPRQYDVITCPLLQPAARDAAFETTTEFFQSVHGHLAEGGIFSLRIPYFDLGPYVVRQLTRRLQATFAEVRMVESVPGELVFLCGRDALPVFDAQVVERFQSPQCRRLLAECGWDWSVVFGRGGLTDDGLKKFQDEAETEASAAELAFALPLEVSRWGRKAETTRDQLARHGQALRTLLGDAPEAKIISERLEDLSLSHKIQKAHPNQPWAYRAALKERLKERPRSTIMPVNHELKRVLDPEDQRRKDYLVALGQAARQSEPAIEDIVVLEQFQAPFDPLLSLFSHYEIAHLLKRSATPAEGRRLAHLLHTVYFASPQDESVRNVAAAITLLCQQAEDGEGWNDVNSLVHVLTQRWIARWATDEQSRYESIDVEESLEAVQAAIIFLNQHHADAGVSESEWSLRRSILEETCLRPLRQRQSRLLRQFAAQPPVKLSR